MTLAAIASTAVVNGVVFSVLLLLMVSVAIIDFRHQVIPNEINLAIFALGLCASFVNPAVGPIAALVAAIFGGAFLAAVQFAFRYLRGYEGLGMGDVKFVAAAATWSGIDGIAMALVLSSMLALAYVGVRHLTRSPVGTTERIPFGPFLAMGFLVIASIQIFAGESIVDVLMQQFSRQ
jgi:leader peptidase (prepilin peptidase) / N-methyltransferase